MPRTGTTLCHPKIGYVDPTRNPALDTLALNSPLGHFNGDNALLSTRRTKTMVTLKFNSYNCNMAFETTNEHNPSHVRRHTLPSQPAQLLITPFRLLTHNLTLHESCSTKSKPNIPCCKIKLFQKHLSTFGIISSSSFSPSFNTNDNQREPFTLSEETTQRKHASKLQPFFANNNKNSG